MENNTVQSEDEIWGVESHKPATSRWRDYDPENPSDKLADGRWYLIDCGDRISTSRWCNQRHWLDEDTAVVKRFARVWP